MSSNLAAPPHKQIAQVAQRQLNNLRAVLEAKLRWEAQAALLPESRKRVFWQGRADEIEASADQCVAAAKLPARLSVNGRARTADASATVSHSAHLSWSLASTASQAYLTVLFLLDTGSAGGFAAVLGSASIVGPTKLQRCSLFTALSDVCLLRAHAIFTTLSSPAVFSASSRSTILDKARVYVKRALVEVGLSWPLDVSEGRGAFADASSPDLHRLLTKKGKEVPPRGWNAVDAQSKALLQTARAIFHRNTFRPRPQAEIAQTNELEVLAEVASALRRGAPHSDNVLITQCWRLILSGERWHYGLLDEEGEAGSSGLLSGLIAKEECEFWAHWSTQTSSH